MRAEELLEQARAQARRAQEDREAAEKERDALARELARKLAEIELLKVALRGRGAPS